MLFCRLLQCKVHLGRNILMVSARVVVTVVRRNNSCLTFIVVCAVHDVAVCGTHVTCLIFFLVTDILSIVSGPLKKWGSFCGPDFEAKRFTDRYFEP